MPNIHVAYRTDPNGAGVRAASKSNTVLRRRISQVIGSTWTIAHYKLAGNADTFCQAIEDITKLPHDGELEFVRVNEAGQVRKVPAAGQT